jgi:hypothetical protein
VKGKIQIRKEYFSSIFYPFSGSRKIILCHNSLSMKTRITLLLIVTIVLFQSCHRAMTPYEAANFPRGKKCRDIK